MEENSNTTFFTFDSPKGQSSYIKVIGVGGGGGNAVNHMFRQGIKGVDFIVCNTDMKALNASPVPNKIPLGDLGLGAGNKPERAKQAALDKENEIREALEHNTQMLFITAGMGGGTGTGAAPVIAEIAKKIELPNEDTKHILVVAIVTLPFSTEGRRRREQAEAGIVELSKHVDSILVINNDKLLSFKDFTLSKAFGMANDVLLTAAKGIAEIITVDAYVNIDFQDVNTVMENSGTALMGSGSGKGENRAHDAIEAATTSVLLNDNDISNAKNVLIYYSYSSDHEITMAELGEITDYLTAKTKGSADIIWGAGADDSLDDELKVTLIATGFEKKAVIDEGPVIHHLDDEPADEVKHTEVKKIIPDTDGMAIIHHEPSAEPKDESTFIPEAVVIPEAAVVQEVVEAVAPAPEPIVPVTEPVAVETPAPANKRVFYLEDEDSAEAPKPAVNSIRAGADDFKTEIDTMVDEIHLVSHNEEEPVAEVAKAIEPEPAPAYRSAFENDNDVTTAAERIRRIHDLLRNNPGGADIVQKMRTEQIADNALYEGLSSADREASSFSLRADGTVAKNPYLYGNNPD
ncbi:MAG: cell division protein FtsZ [Bacteroidales bacterium]|nr:cell division protein FtsZ [Bacteroidales bacterium]